MEDSGRLGESFEPAVLHALRDCPVFQRNTLSQQLFVTK